MMKKKLLVILLILCTSPFVSAQDTAKEVFLKATEVLSTENIEMIISIDETDANGHLKTKELRVLKAKFEGEEKTKVVFQKPERAKGTTINITELPSETGTIEVYTPSNDKTRKLKATDSNMKKMGVGLSMTSVADYDPDNLKYEMLNDTIVNGKTCYQIKVSGTGTKDISSAILLIQKDLNYIIQTTQFNEKNEALSLTKLSDYKNIEGQARKMYPMHIVIEDFENKKDLDIRILMVSIRSDLTKASFAL